MGSLVKKWLFHFRFFYDNIWREWDADDDGDYCFASRHLETRLQLYHEIQDGNLPKDLVQRYKGTPLTLLRIVHPRRPRGSQSGREKRRDESFQVQAIEPLGTDSHRTISKNSSGCRLLIGHKKCFVLLCPIGEHILWVPFVCSYTTVIVSITACLGDAPKKRHALRKLSVWYKSPSDFKILSVRKLKTLFQKYEL